MPITDAVIIKVYFRNSHGIRGTAGALGISKVRVGRVITAYKKRHHIR